MTRYIRGYVSETHTPESRPTCEVVVPSDAPVYSGLLDADGTPLYRVTETVPIGFRGRNWT